MGWITHTRNLSKLQAVTNPRIAVKANGTNAGFTARVAFGQVRPKAFVDGTRIRVEFGDQADIGKVRLTADQNGTTRLRANGAKSPVSSIQFSFPSGVGIPKRKTASVETKVVSIDDVSIVLRLPDLERAPAPRKHTPRGKPETGTSLVQGSAPPRAAPAGVQSKLLPGRR